MIGALVESLANDRKRGDGRVPTPCLSAVSCPHSSIAIGDKWGRGAEPGYVHRDLSPAFGFGPEVVLATDHHNAQ